MTTHHHVFRGSCESIGGLLSPQVTNLPCFVVIDLVEEGILSFQFFTWPQVITWSECHVTLWVSSLLYKSLSCQVWCSQTLWKRRYFVFGLSGDLRRLHIQGGVWNWSSFPSLKWLPCKVWWSWTFWKRRYENVKQQFGFIRENSSTQKNKSTRRLIPFK